jgi:D-alanyl-D-alanine dipeptidase
VRLDPGIHLDIRYATKDNFMGMQMYETPRAFLQRDAAAATVRANHALAKQGFGILVHDAYRPWYVTKMFWDATPDSGKDYVADPAKGSRHNRGCAADVTLYDLATGKAVDMPGRYDETSARSSPLYLGGTSLERWHRDLLKSAMEAQGFAVYTYEWWHFDYAGWEQYPIMNVEFDRVGPAPRE